MPQFSSIIIHGGYNEAESKTVYSLNLETLLWKLSTQNTESLIGHSAVEIDGRMFIFGGWNEKEYTNTSILYDPLDDTIKKSNFPANQNEWEYPNGRRDHTLTYANNHVYLLGGWDSWKWTNSTSSFGRLWKMNENWKWELCEVFGENPSMRRGHSTVYFEEYDELIVFGGIYGLSTLLDDIYALHLKDMQWNKLSIDQAPSKRAWHSAAGIGNCMYIFGGLIELKKTCNKLFKFDVLQRIWTEIYIESILSPRCGGLMLNAENFLVILGGRNQAGESLNDIYVIDINGKFQEYQEYAKLYGVKYQSISSNIPVPIIPKELSVSRKYVKRTRFNFNSFF
jgi:N-acetylneuraminic acid mutarotase